MKLALYAGFIEQFSRKERPSSAVALLRRMDKGRREKILNKKLGDLGGLARYYDIPQPDGIRM